MESSKTVYIAMSCDVLDHNHVRTIQEAQKLGQVIVGVLTDQAIARVKKLPQATFLQRKALVDAMAGVTKVVVQDAVDPTNTITSLQPDFVMHGEHVRLYTDKVSKDRLTALLASWGGQLVDVASEEAAVSSEKTTPAMRRKKLRRLLQAKDIVRVIESHNGLSGLIAENERYEKDGEVREFDAMWLSSLTDSTAKGKPDIELVGRMDTLHMILECTTKPIIVDGDTGGIVEHFVFTVRSLERLGISAVIIEDKVGLKKNSLFGTDVKQQQADIETFCQKITAGKQAQVTDDFMIISRIESLILKKGLDDAIARAKAYIGAGTDGIMIHSKDDNPDEIIAFCKQYKQFSHKVPLVVVPSTYNMIYEKELIDLGVNVVIYANQLLRTAYPAMSKVAQTILAHERSYECNDMCMPIKDILTLIPGGK